MFHIYDKNNEYFLDYFFDKIILNDHIVSPCNFNFHLFYQRYEEKKDRVVFRQNGLSKNTLYVNIKKIWTSASDFFKIVEIGATPWSRFKVVDYYQNPFIGVKKNLNLIWPRKI